MANKILFRTAYADHIRVPVESGTRLENEYGYEIDSYGRKVLVKTGETDLYAKIQLSLEETKIENILARCTAGDTSMLRPDGIYADLTEMPNNLIEARQAMQKLENTWNGLGADLKNKYGNSLDTFIAEAGKEGWLRDMGLLPAEAKAVAEAEAVAKETKVPKTIDAGGEVNE